MGTNARASCLPLTTPLSKVLCESAHLAQSASRRSRVGRVLDRGCGTRDADRSLYPLAPGAAHPHTRRARVCSLCDLQPRTGHASGFSRSHSSALSAAHQAVTDRYSGACRPFARRETSAGGYRNRSSPPFLHPGSRLCTRAQTGTSSAPSTRTDERLWARSTIDPLLCAFHSRSC